MSVRGGPEAMVLLAEFAAAVLDPARPVPAGLIDPDGEPSAKRFSVYRNNVVVGLVEVLAAAFPVVRRLVGAEFFAAMARIHVAGELPCSPILLSYGAGFPDFVGTFEPAAALPYLRDVARLERAWVQAYHAPEATPRLASAFTAIAADQLPHIKLELHPSLYLVRSPWPIVTIWKSNVDREVSAHIEIDAGAQSALVVRPGAEVEVRTVTVGASVFIEAMTMGAPIVRAAESALLGDPLFDLGAVLAGLMEAGAIVGWQV